MSYAELAFDSNARVVQVERVDAQVTEHGRAVGRLSIVSDAFYSAIGRLHRDDPIEPRTGGPAGNARLTAWTGLLLLGLSLAELVTLLDVGSLISWHIVIGTVLVPPALLKTATTGWRVIRYYRRNPSYRHAGPPPLLLRILGPGVVLSTLGLLGSGLVLIFLGQSNSGSPLITVLGQRVDWLTVHQGLFIVWAVFTGLHVIGRFVPALNLVIFPKLAADGIDGGRNRATILIATLAVAAVSAALVLSASGSWRQDNHHGRTHRSANFGLGTHT
jgi:hypothetical protein